LLQHDSFLNLFQQGMQQTYDFNFGSSSTPPGSRRGRVHQADEVEAALTAAGLMPPRPPGWITEPEDLVRLLTSAGFSNVGVDKDTHSFRYADADEYWQQARGTGLRHTLDALGATQNELVRSAVAERMRRYQRPDGFYLAATALLAVADR
jgi:hypothetical protein